MVVGVPETVLAVMGLVALALGAVTVALPALSVTTPLSRARFVLAASHQTTTGLLFSSNATRTSVPCVGSVEPCRAAHRQGPNGTVSPGWITQSRFSCEPPTGKPVGAGGLPERWGVMGGGCSFGWQDCGAVRLRPCGASFFRALL